MKHIHKILVLTLFVFLSASVAMAAEFGDIRYPDRPLNLRTGRSPKTKWVGTLQVGQEVRVAYLKDGWVAVFEPYMTRESDVRIAGYANVKYLKKTRGKVKIEPWGEIMHPVTVLNIRAKRSPGSDKVGSVTPRTNVKVDFPEDGWYAVFESRASIRSKSNAIGYVKSDYLEPAPVATVEAAPAAEPITTPAQSGVGEVRSSVAPAPEVKPEVETPEETANTEAVSPAPWGEVVTIKNTVQVRKERSSSAHYVRTLNPGDTVKLDMLKDGWYAVFDADETVRGEHKALGYVFKRQLEQGDTPAQASSKIVSKETTAPQKTSTPKKIVIKPDPFASSRRPDPKADQNRHGISFKILEESQTSRQGEDVIFLKVFVDVKTLPKAALLEDFTNTLWKEHRRSGKQVQVDLYLPGMDLEDLAFVVARYDDKEQLEFWARKTALFGTKYMK
ncbi:SH3 domain-containing protein [Salidesulfovibrio onnuriiensis]|uniref:SH3 domain-containing protein n=1 Tax=Salidesulfovibrio onnuriiensis TaxID=2583823 RepID=UPI0011C77F89|nr:SH3 domain-containing protein [Salidesulfovibrio onnuriiensis]